MLTEDRVTRDPRIHDLLGKVVIVPINEVRDNREELDQRREHRRSVVDLNLKASTLAHDSTVSCFSEYSP